jgi:hypothetical protein
MFQGRGIIVSFLDLMTYVSLGKNTGDWRKVNVALGIRR